MHAVSVLRRDDIAGLIFAEPESVAGGARRRFQNGADTGRHRHLGERDKNAAIGNIVHRRDHAVADRSRAQSHHGGVRR